VNNLFPKTRVNHRFYSTLFFGYSGRFWFSADSLGSTFKDAEDLLNPSKALSTSSGVAKTIVLDWSELISLIDYKVLR